MIEEKLVRLRAHDQNLKRYRRLLQGNLSGLERDYVERRISDEEASLARLFCDCGLVRPASVDHLG